MIGKRIKVGKPTFKYGKMNHHTKGRDHIMSIYEFEVNKINGETISLEEYKGKVMIIVNTASKCGFSPQYDDLQSLYVQYKEDGVVVLGFPCNQFLNQEPGDDLEIDSYCKLNHGVTFPMFAKSECQRQGSPPLIQLSD